MEYLNERNEMIESISKWLYKDKLDNLIQEVGIDEFIRMCKILGFELVYKNSNSKKAALDIMNEWNDFAGKYNLNRVLKITDKRISNVNQRLAEADFNIYHIFQRIEESDFLQGKNKEGWKVDFDFVFGSKNNWVKIMEGKYATNKSSGGATPEELRAIVQRRADREQAGSQSL